MISQWVWPGWQATLDDQPVDLLTADGGLAAVIIPPGRHTVLLRYWPRDVFWGGGITLLTLIITIVLAFLWRPAIPKPIQQAEGVEEEKEEGDDTPATSFQLENGQIAIGFRPQTWLIFLILVGFGLRLFLLGNQELRGDEAFSYLYTRLAFNEVIPELIDQGDPHPPLHYVLLNSWTRLAGDSEMGLRYLSLIPGVLLIPVIYQLGRRLGSDWIGVAAAGFTAASPSLIWLSQDVRNQYTLTILFASLATLFLVQASSSGKRRWLYWLLYVLAGALIVYSHYYGVFALLAHGLYLWFVPNRRQNYLAWFASGAAVVLLFVPWLWLSWTTLIDAGQLSDPATPELARHLVAIGRELVVGQSLPEAVARWLFLGVLALCVLGGWLLFRQRPSWAALLIGWLGLAAIAIFLVRFNRSTFNPFYISVAAPALWLLAGVAVVWLWQQRQWWRYFAPLFVIGLGAAIVISLSNYYFDPTYSRTNGYRAVAEHIEAQKADDEFFVAHFPDPAWDYYFRHSDLPRQMLPTMQDASIGRNRSIFE